MTSGRPREFDEAVVLERLMKLFWESGYRGTGMDRVCRETGLSRQSLYNAFGDKRELFRLAILHYRDSRLAGLLALLKKSEKPLEAVRTVLGHFRRQVAEHNHNGCLVANALTEIAGRDPELEKLLKDTLRLLEDAFRGALDRARKNGDLSADVSPRCVARSLTNAFLGMAVTSKLSGGGRLLDDVFDGTLLVLK